MPNPFDIFDEKNPFDVFDEKAPSVEQEKSDIPVVTDTGGFVSTVLDGPTLYDPKKTIKNLPKNAINYTKNMVGLVTKPKETAEEIGGLLSGGVQAAMAVDEVTPERDKFNRLVEHYKESYGDFPKAMKTLEERPIDFAADLSTMLMGVGGLTGLTGKLSKSSALTSTGKDIVDLGASMEPITATARTATGGVRALIPKNYAREAYKSAVKFNTTLSTDEVNKLAQTALDAGIMPTVDGIEKLSGLIDDLDSGIASIIDEGTASGLKIPTYKLFKHFGDVETKALGDLMEGPARAAIKEVKDQLTEKIRRGKTELTPKEVQTMKQQVYKRLQSSYASNKYDPIGVQAQKAVARAAKESLEELFPEIKGLNQQDGDYIALMKAIQQKANRISNRDVLGIGIPIKGTAGGVAGGKVGAAIGLVAGVLDTPQVKAKLAIVANKLKKNGVKLSPSHALVRLGLVNIGKSASESGWRVTNTKVDSITDEDVQRLFDIAKSQ